MELIHDIADDRFLLFGIHNDQRASAIDDRVGRDVVKGSARNADKEGGGEVNTGGLKLLAIVHRSSVLVLIEVRLPAGERWS